MKALIRHRTILSSSNFFGQATLGSLFILIVVMLQGCATPTGGDVTQWQPADPLKLGHEDLFRFVHSVRIDETGKAFDHRVVWLKPDTVRMVDPEELKPEHETFLHRKPLRVHPLLWRWTKERSNTEVVEVLIQLEDSFKIPRLPEPAKEVKRGSKEFEEVLALRQDAIHDIAKLRRKRQSQFLNGVAPCHCPGESRRSQWGRIRQGTLDWDHRRRAINSIYPGDQGPKRWMKP